MNASTEIAAQLDHIVSGKCRWVPRTPREVITYTYDAPQEACLIERIDSAHLHVVRMSPTAQWHVARAIAELHPDYDFFISTVSAAFLISSLYDFCVNWNDRPVEVQVDVRSEAQVIEVLERGLKYALIDEGM